MLEIVMDQTGLRRSTWLGQIRWWDVLQLLEISEVLRGERIREAEEAGVGECEGDNIVRTDPRMACGSLKGSVASEGLSHLWMGSV